MTYCDETLTVDNPKNHIEKKGYVATLEEGSLKLTTRWV